MTLKNHTFSGDHISIQIGVWDEGVTIDEELKEVIALGMEALFKSNEERGSFEKCWKLRKKADDLIHQARQMISKQLLLKRKQRSE